MKFNTLLGLIIVIIFCSCKNEKDSNFILKGSVKGLKKGVVYLQQEDDSTLINLDSVTINGQSSFILKTNIEEPILLYLKLFQNDGQEHYIPFFADKGETEINTTLKNFSFDAKIKGSEQQALLDEYLKVMSKFNDQNLDIIEATFLAQKANDSIRVDSLTRTSEALMKRKYTYTIQYALNHNNSEVAAYLALYEIPNANPIFVDSIYNGLTNNIKESYYGLKLKDRISNPAE